MDEKRSISPARNGLDRPKSSSLEEAVPEEVIRRFRGALSEQKGKGLSAPALEALHDLCARARVAGVPPEQVIVRVKEEIRSRVEFSEQSDVDRARLEQAVTECIQSFFGVRRPVS